MKQKKWMRLLGASAVLGCLVTSCLSDEEPYSAGFQFAKPTSAYTQLYANTVRDSVVLLSGGSWRIENLGGSLSTWCQMGVTSGSGNQLYAFPVTFTQNRTGEARYAQFRATDVAHPDVTANWLYIQHATRGDGSLGNAALVKEIQSSDGYKAAVEYDELCRPVLLTVTAPGGDEFQRVAVEYQGDTEVVVTFPRRRLSGPMGTNYLAQRYYGETDTLGYYSQYNSFGEAISANYAFNFEDRKAGGDYLAYAYLLNGQSLGADSLHCADSLIYVRHTRATSDTYIERMKLTYSRVDNRHQSLDVNQLLLGFEECHPMLLLSMFSYARSTSVVSKAETSTGNIVVTTELNADESVRAITVSDERKHTDVTYTFTY